MKTLYWIACIFFILGYGLTSEQFKPLPEKKSKAALYVIAGSISAPVIAPLIAGFELGEYRHRIDSLATVQNCNVEEEETEENVNIDE